MSFAFTVVVLVWGLVFFTYACVSVLRKQEKVTVHTYLNSAPLFHLETFILLRVQV